MQSWDLITPTPPVKHKSVMEVQEEGGGGVSKMDQVQALASSLCSVIVSETIFFRCASLQPVVQISARKV